MAKKKHLTIAMSLVLSVSLLFGVAISALATGDDPATSFPDEVVEIMAEEGGDTPEEYSSADIVGEDDVDADDSNGGDGDAADVADTVDSDTAGDVDAVDTTDNDGEDPVSEDFEEDEDPDTSSDPEPDDVIEDENTDDETEEPDADDGTGDSSVPENEPDAESEPVRVVNPAGGNVILGGPLGDPVGGDDEIEVEDLGAEMAGNIRFTFTIDNEAVILNGEDQLAAVNINPQEAFSKEFPKLENVQFTLRTVAPDDLLTISHSALQDGVHVDKTTHAPYGLVFTFDEIDTSKFNETQTISNVFLQFLNGLTPNGTKGELYVENIYFEVTDDDDVTTGYEYTYEYAYGKSSADGKDAPKLVVTAKGGTSWKYESVSTMVDEAAVKTLELPAEDALQPDDDLLENAPLAFTVTLKEAATVDGKTGIEPTARINYAARLTVPASLAIAAGDIETGGGKIYGMVTTPATGPDEEDVTELKELTGNDIISGETVTIVWEAVGPASPTEATVIIQKACLTEAGLPKDKQEVAPTDKFSAVLQLDVGGNYTHDEKNEWSRSFGGASSAEKISGTPYNTITISKAIYTPPKDVDPKLVLPTDSQTYLQPRAWQYSINPHNTTNHFGTLADNTSRDEVFYNEVLGDPMYYAMWVNVVGMGVPSGNIYTKEQKNYMIPVETLSYTVDSVGGTYHYIQPIGFTPGAFLFDNALGKDSKGKEFENFVADRSFENFTVTATIVDVTNDETAVTLIIEFDADGNMVGVKKQDPNDADVLVDATTEYDQYFSYHNGTHAFYLKEHGKYYLALTWEFADVDRTMAVDVDKTPAVLFAIMDLTDEELPQSVPGSVTINKDGISGNFSLDQVLTTEITPDLAWTDDEGEPVTLEKGTVTHSNTNRPVKWRYQKVNDGPKKEGVLFDEDREPIDRTLKNGDIVDFTLTYVASSNWRHVLIRDESQYLDVDALDTITIKLYPKAGGTYADLNAYKRSALQTADGSVAISGSEKIDKDGVKYWEYVITGDQIYKYVNGSNNASGSYGGFDDSDFAEDHDGFVLYFMGVKDESCLYAGDTLYIEYSMTVINYSEALAKAGEAPHNNAHSKTWNDGPYPPPWVDEGGWKAPVRGAMEAVVELTIDDTSVLAPYVANSATLFGALIDNNEEENEEPKGPVFVYDLFSTTSSDLSFVGLEKKDIDIIKTVNAYDIAENLDLTDPDVIEVYEKYEEIVSRYVKDVIGYTLDEDWETIENSAAGSRTNAATSTPKKYVYGTDYSVRFYHSFNKSAGSSTPPSSAATARYVVIAFNPEKVELGKLGALQATVGNWAYQNGSYNGSITTPATTTSKLYFSPTNDFFTPMNVYKPDKAFTYGREGDSTIGELTLMKLGAATFGVKSGRQILDTDPSFPYIWASANARYYTRQYQIESKADDIVNLSAIGDTSGDKKFYEGDLLQHTYTLTNSSAPTAPDPYVLRGFSAILPEGQQVYEGSDYKLSVKVSGVTIDPSRYTVDVLDYKTEGDKRQLVVTWKDDDTITLPATSGKNTAVLTFQSKVDTVDESTWLTEAVKTQYAGYFDKLERTVPMNGHDIHEYNAGDTDWFAIKGIQGNTGFHRLGAEKSGYTYTEHISPSVEITIAGGAKPKGNKFEIALANNSVLWYSVELKNPLQNKNGHHQVSIDDYLLVVVLPAGVDYRFASSTMSSSSDGSRDPVSVNGAEHFENAFGEHVLVWQGTSLAVDGDWKVYLRTVLAGTHVGDLYADAYLIPYDQYFGPEDIVGVNNKGTRALYDNTLSYHFVGGDSNSLLDGRADELNQRLRAGYTPMMTDDVTVDVINPVGASGYLTVKEVDTSNATSNGIIEVNRGSDLLFTSELRNRSTGTTYKDITMIEELPSIEHNLSGWEPTLLLDKDYELKVAGSTILADKYQVYLLPGKWSVDSASEANWVLWEDWAQYAADYEDDANPTAIKVVFNDGEGNEILLGKGQSAFFSWYMHVEEFEELDKFNLNAYARTRFDFDTSNNGRFALRSSTVGVRLMYMDGAAFTVTKEIGGDIEPGTFWFRLERWVTGVDYDDSFRVTTANVDTADEETGWFSITVPEDATEASVTLVGLEEGKYRIVEEDIPVIIEDDIPLVTNVVYSVQYAINSTPSYPFEVTDEIHLYKGRGTLVGVMNTNNNAVVYHAGEGTGDDRVEYVAKQASHTVLSNEDDTQYIPPYGFEFVGWSPNPAGSTVVYNPGYELLPDAKITHLTALYKHDGETYYTLTYDPNGGVGGGSEKIIPGNSTIIAQAADYEVSREGYSFLGWSAQKTGGANPTYAPGKTLKLERDMTLYAIWKKDNNGGDGSQPDASSGPTSEPGSEPNSGPNSGPGSEPKSEPNSGPASEPGSNPGGDSSPGGGTGGSSSDAGSGIDTGSTTSRGGGIGSGPSSQTDGGGTGGGGGGGDASAPGAVSSTAVTASSVAASSGSSSTPDGNAGGTDGGGGGTEADPGAGGGTDGTGAGGDGAGGDADGDGAGNIALGDYDPNNTVDLFGNELPLGGLNVTNAWSLLNLVVSVIALLCSVVGGVSILRNREGKHRAGGFKTGGTIVGVVPIILFLILENLRADMVLVTKWTPLIIAVFVVQLLLVILAWVRTRQDQKQDEDDDQPPAEAPIQA